MTKDEIIKFLEANRHDIEADEWDLIFDRIAYADRGEFVDFLISNGLSANRLFQSRIPAYAFWGSVLISTVRLYNNITIIEDHAFYRCMTLTSIVLPKTVRVIGQEAFAGCKSLKEIIFKGSQEEWEAIEKGDGWNINCPAKITFLK